ncbi:MAG: VOC family protein, partial [Chloroflexi bacterium]
MEKFTIHPQTTVGTVTLTVSNLSAQVDFYHRALGLHLRAHTDDYAVLGTTTTPLVILRAASAAASPPPRAAGLYHLAILLPDRAALGSWLIHYAKNNYPLLGASDHGVSEALYLSDPEGNGIEVYRDRPRTEWPFAANGRLQMVTAALNLRQLAGAGSNSPWAGAPDGTRMGHIHLKVNDLRQTEAFYADVLGFDVMQNDYPGATFLSAGGYHHHLGGNTWHSAGGPPLPPGALGLDSFT